jgi:hypothetical protein
LPAKVITNKLRGRKYVENALRASGLENQPQMMISWF